MGFVRVISGGLAKVNVMEVGGSTVNDEGMSVGSRVGMGGIMVRGGVIVGGSKIVESMKQVMINHMGVVYEGTNHFLG